VSFSHRYAVAGDVPFVMALQRSNRESVGGLPRPAIEDRVRRGTLLLGLLNDEPAGYLMFDVGAGLLRIPQACIQYDARRRRYGEALVGRMLGDNPDVSEVRLRCAADMDANLFWRDMGFTCVGTTQGGKRRGRLLNLWQRWCGAPRLFGVEEMAQVPAWQWREDSMYDDSGFLVVRPEGFADRGSLGKLAWSNRKKPRLATRQPSADVSIIQT
jgi:hypothetical protein